MSRSAGLATSGNLGVHRVSSAVIQSPRSLVENVRDAGNNGNGAGLVCLVVDINQFDTLCSVEGTAKEIYSQGEVRNLVRADNKGSAGTNAGTVAIGSRGDLSGVRAGDGAAVNRQAAVANLDSSRTADLGSARNGGGDGASKVDGRTPSALNGGNLRAVDIEAAAAESLSVILTVLKVLRTITALPRADHRDLSSRQPPDQEAW